MRDTITVMPTPMLKVLNMSWSLMTPTFAIRSNIGSTLIILREILAVRPSGIERGMFS